VLPKLMDQSDVNMKKNVDLVMNYEIHSDFNIKGKPGKVN
jgi:hypothetical protein